MLKPAALAIISRWTASDVYIIKTVYPFLVAEYWYYSRVLVCIQGTTFVFTTSRKNVEVPEPPSDLATDALKTPASHYW